MTPVQCEPAMEALAGLLDEFQHGNIVATSAEEEGMQRHATLYGQKIQPRPDGGLSHKDF
jgi:hypothetical protein